MEPGQLADDVVYQIGALQAMCRVAGTAVRYVKPHGALYNAIVHHERQAAAVVAAVRDYDPTLPVLGLPGSAFLRAAEAAGLRTVRSSSSTAATPRRRRWSRADRDGALLQDPGEVTERVMRLVEDGVVVAVDGSRVPLAAESLCVHGDSPGAVEMAGAVRAGLERAGVQLAAFAAEPAR